MFTTAGGVSASYIAKWDGTSWSALGSGTDGEVLGLGVSGTDLYVGGGFTKAGDKPSNYIACWHSPQPSITVTSPSAGDSWLSGTTKDIRWTASELAGNLTIDLYKSGSFDSSIGAAPATQGVYSWSIPPNQATGNDYKIRIYQGSILGESGVFSIASTLGSTISLSRTNFFFSFVVGGDSTKPQAVVISNSGLGVLSWTATPNQTWITVLPASGTGTTQIAVGVDPSGLGAGTYTGAISLTATGAANSPQAINVTLKVYNSGATSSPFGVFETPVDGTSGIEGSVPVTGWALDDIEVTKVDIWRDPVSGEATIMPSQSQIKRIFRQTI